MQLTNEANAIIVQLIEMESKRCKLNELVIRDNVSLSSGEILKLSQEIDKLIIDIEKWYNNY